MEINKRIKGMRPIIGFIVAVLGILFLIFIAAPIQVNFGMTGLAITEIGILLIAVVAALICRANLKEVFPIKRPTLREVFGTILIWIGTLIGVLISTLIMAHFFPEGFSQVSEGLNNVITSVSMGVAFFIVAVMPAICEEALMRGFILSSFRSFKSKWLIVILVGVIFGIYHLDPYRFLPTAILGMSMAYIMLETNNLLYPILLHFINNGFSTLVTFLNPAQSAATMDTFSVPLASIGAFFIIGSIVPFALLLGGFLLRKKGVSTEAENNKRKINPVYIAAFATAAMLVVGFTITMKTMNLQPIFNSNMTMKVNCETEDMVMPMTVEKSGVYMMQLAIENERGLIHLQILDEKGSCVFGASAMNYTSTNALQLEQGEYNIKISFYLDNLDEYYEKVDNNHKYSKEELNLTGDLTKLEPVKISLAIQ